MPMKEQGRKNQENENEPLDLEPVYQKITQHG